MIKSEVIPASLIPTQLLYSALSGGDAPIPVFLLQDDFTDTLAAGSVNGTLATPGGTGTTAQKTRTVPVDAGNFLSLANGNLIIAGATADDNPTIRWGAFTRTPGLILVVKVIHGADENTVFGWDNNQVTGINNMLQITYADGVQLAYSGVALGTLTLLATQVVADTYYMAMVLKSTGFYAFIKGGIWPSWTLFWIANGGVDATLYPAITTANNRSVTPTFAFVRVPEALYLPPVLAYDTFTRSNGAIGSTETGGPDLQSVNARAWIGVPWTISANKAINTPAALGAELLTNPGFDVNTGSWTGDNATLASIAGGQAGNCLELTMTGTATQGAYQAAGVSHIWYKLSGYVKSGTSGNETGRVVLQENAGGLVSVYYFAITSSGAWQAFSCTGKVATATARFRFTKASATAGTMLFDTATIKALTLSELIASVQVSSANVLVSVDIVKSAALDGLQSGLCLRLDSEVTPANFILAYLDGMGNCRLDKCVAGVYTSFIAAAVTYAASARLVVILDESSVSVYYANVLVGSTATVSDAGILTNTMHGLFSTDASNTLDNFQVMARGGGTYDALNNFIKGG